MAMQKRLQKELMALRKDTPPGMKVDFDNITTHGEDTQIFVDIEGPKDSLYVGETFRLRFRFSPQYPFEAPEVVFVGLSPSAAHFYSNGHGTVYKLEYTRYVTYHRLSNTPLKHIH